MPAGCTTYPRPKNARAARAPRPSAGRSHAELVAASPRRYSYEWRGERANRQPVRRNPVHDDVRAWRKGEFA